MTSYTWSSCIFIVVLPLCPSICALVLYEHMYKHLYIHRVNQWAWAQKAGPNTVKQIVSICLVGITPSNNPGSNLYIFPYMVKIFPSIALFGHRDSPLVREYNYRAREYCLLWSNIWTILAVHQFIRSDWTTYINVKTNGTLSWVILRTDSVNLKSS